MLPVTAYWFHDVSDPIRAELMAVSKARCFFDNETIVQQGEVNRSVFLVQSGHLESFHARESGDRFRIRTILPGQSFGETQFGTDLVTTNSVQSVGESTALEFTHQDLRSLGATYPELLVGIAKTLNVLLSRSSKMLNLALLSPVSERIRWRLSVIAEDHHGPPTPWIQSDLSQSALAEMIGISRQVLNAELKRMELEGLVRLNYKKISISRDLLDQAPSLELQV